METVEVLDIRAGTGTARLSVLVTLRVGNVTFTVPARISEAVWAEWHREEEEDYPEPMPQLVTDAELLEDACVPLRQGPRVSVKKEVAHGTHRSARSYSPPQRRQSQGARLHSAARRGSG
jgi:hypothetical protein